MNIERDSSSACSNDGPIPRPSTERVPPSTPTTTRTDRTDRRKDPMDRSSAPRSPFPSSVQSLAKIHSPWRLVYSLLLAKLQPGKKYIRPWGKVYDLFLTTTVGPTMGPNVISKGPLKGPSNSNFVYQINRTTEKCCIQNPNMVITS